ncbi:MAG: hypothetical protein LBI29_03830, partial [Rickettsiales bacterium]|nr:hypothetical protein [Rickettsiales bacterium]
EVLNKTTESIDYDKKSAYTTWKHSGGAYWGNTSSPRNTSASMDRTGTFSNSSRNIGNVLKNGSATDYSGEIENKYKYVKKVRGICVNPYGYYNRGSTFLNAGEFDQQLKNIKPQNTKMVDPRETTLVTNSTQTTGPYRVCTSANLWGGISGRCFRACEMMNIYNTELDPELYHDWVNFKESDKYFIENSQILTVDTRRDQDLDESYREDRLTLYNLRSEDLRDSTTFIRGDYLTGGATWPRTTVIVESSVETAGDKKGLRYVEVIGGCDSTYDRTTDPQPSQYIILNENNRPKRKCYEDGTWGQVYKDTKCLLAKNCAPFSFWVEDLAELIKLYRENIAMSIGGNALLEKVNDFIANVYYNQKNKTEEECETGEDDRKKYQCELPRFNAANTSMETVITNGSYSTNPLIVDENAYQKVPEALYPTICCLSNKCLSKSYAGRAYKPGWNIDDADIGKYFIPLTCIIGSRTTDEFEVGPTDDDNYLDVKYLNRLEFLSDTDNSTKPHYAKNSLLYFVYNWLESGSGNYRESTFIDGETIYDSEKDVDIGSKYYKSYQLRARCRNDYFFNEYTDAIGGNGKVVAAPGNKNNNYYDKDIIFECKSAESDDRKARFTYHSKTKQNGDLVNIIRANDCKPKTCGGNIYQSLWSMSIIKEVASDASRYAIDYTKDVPLTGITNDVLSTDKYISKLSCSDTKKDGMETAFIISYDEEEGLSENKNVDFYKITDSEGNVVSNYESRNFVKTLKTNCIASGHTDGKINGKAAPKEYDRHAYGELANNTLPHRFCRDIGKSTCDTVSETTLMSDLANFKDKYCIKMSCPGKKLKFDSTNKKILYNQTSGYFDLPDTTSTAGVSEYTFGSVVVIQSYNGDYKDNLKVSSSLTVNKKYVQNDSAGSGDGKLGGTSVCGTDQDMYNDTIASYSLDKFAEGKSNAKEIYECFELIEGGESGITKKSSGACGEGQTDVGGDVCVKYSTSSGDDETEKAIKALRTAANGYTAPESLKDDTLNFLMTMTPPDSSLQQELDTIEASSKAYAKTQTTNSFKATTTGLICKYDNEISQYSADTDGKYDGIAWYDDIADGKIYGLVREATSSDSCKKTVDGASIMGKYFLERTTFDDKYETEYGSQKTTLIETLKTNIKAGTKLATLYNEYHKVFKMKDFLTKVSITKTVKNDSDEDVSMVTYTNLNNFNIYLQDLVETGFQALYFNGGTTEMFRFQEEQTDNGSNITTSKGIDFTASTNAQYICKSGQSAENMTSCTLDQAYKAYIDVAYQKYFLNFLENSENSGSTDENDDSYSPKHHIKEYIETKNTKENNCKNIYKTFPASKTSYETNTANYSFRSGFFMAMKCTPEGWETIDSPSCRKRCNVTSETAKVNPTGGGKWNVYITANSIRHTRKYRFVLGGIAKINCCGRKAASEKSEITFGCNDGTITDSSHRNDTGDADGWELNDEGLGCIAVVFVGGVFASLCFCNEMKCSALGKIKETSGSGLEYEYRSGKNSEDRVIYACPKEKPEDPNKGGDTGDTSTKSCGDDNKLDNTAILKYHISKQ